MQAAWGFAADLLTKFQNKITDMLSQHAKVSGMKSQVAKALTKDISMFIKTADGKRKDFQKVDTG